MVFTPLVAKNFPDFYYRMKRLHQQVGGDAQASETTYRNHSIRKEEADSNSLTGCMRNIIFWRGVITSPVESKKFLDTHLRKACRKLEIAFPISPANEDKQQRSRRSVLAHSHCAMRIRRPQYLRTRSRRQPDDKPWPALLHLSSTKSLKMTRRSCSNMLSTWGIPAIVQRASLLVSEYLPQDGNQ
jgi:hypothetical protein